MNGHHRFLYDLVLTVDNTVPSEVAQGRIYQGTKEISVGGAAGRAGGIYTGSQDLQWVVEVNDVGGGSSIGQARFRYSKDNGMTWAQTGLLTAFTPVALELGVTFAWASAASGVDFATGDRWRFKTVLPFGIASAFNYPDRNAVYRSRDVAGTKTIDADFGPAGAIIRTVYLIDHNLTGASDGKAAATVRFKANAVLEWATPPVNVVIPYHPRVMGAFFNGGSYRYSRLEITNPDNGAGFLELGTLYEGDFLQLSRKWTRGRLPWVQPTQRFGATIESPRSGYRRERIDATAQAFTVGYFHLPQDLYDQVVTMREVVWAPGGENQPVIFVPDHLDPTTAFVCAMTGFEPPQQSVPRAWDVDLELRELVRL